jgi:hypothetical protein
MKKICLLLIIACFCSCNYERNNEKLESKFKEQYSEQEKLNNEAKEFEKQKKIERERYVNSLKFDDLDSLLAEHRITASEYATRLLEQERRQQHSTFAIDLEEGRQETIRKNLGTDLHLNR